MGVGADSAMTALVRAAKIGASAATGTMICFFPFSCGFCRTFARFCSFRASDAGADGRLGATGLETPNWAAVFCNFYWKRIKRNVSLNLVLAA